MDEMIDHAIMTTSDVMNPNIRSRLRGTWNRRMRGMRHLDLAMRTLPTRTQRMVDLMSRLATGSWAAWWHLHQRLTGGPGFLERQADLMKSWLEKEGIGPVLIPVAPSQPEASCRR
jgi:hypothetical protein